MAQRDNMPEGTDSIIDGASGSSGTSGGTGYGSGTGGTSGGASYAGGLGTAGGAGYGGATGGGSTGGGLGATTDAMGAASGANLGGGSDFGSAGMGGTGGSSTTAFGSSASTGEGSGGTGSTGSGLSGGVANLKSQATDKARQAAMQGKDRATDALGNVSTLVRDAAQMVDERLGNGYGEYARKAAGAIDGLSDQLRNKEVDELLNDARGFIRKSPGVAIGIAATAGFLLVRVLKAGTGGAGTGTTGTTGTGYAANDGATPPMVGSRGGIA